MVSAVTSSLLVGILLTSPLVVHGCTTLGDYFDCSIFTYNDCWCYLEDHVNDLDDSIVPTYTEEELAPLCDAYSQVQTCINNFIHDCHPRLQYEFESVDASWHYICVETREEFVTEHRICLDDEDLHAEGEHVCYDPFIENLDRIRQSDKHIEEKFERQCHLVNTYLDCVENLIISYDNCSPETALWQRELDRRWIAPLLTGTGCEIQNSTNGKIVYVYKDIAGTSGQQGEQSEGSHSSISQGALIGTTVTLGVIILVVGFMIAFKYMSNKKQQNSREANPPAAQTNQPPRYTVPYGYGGGAVAFGVFNDPLPGKDSEKGNFDAEKPPEYKEQDGGDMDYTPPSQPPPYTGFPQTATNPLYSTRYSPATDTMTGVEN